MDDTDMFCCDKFRPLRRITDSQDATLWTFATEMSCHSIPASSQKQTPFMLAILSSILDCVGYIIQYEKWVDAEGQGKRYFLPHPKREGGYLEVAEEMVRDKELKGEYKMYWGYVKIKCCDHQDGGTFQMLRIFQRVLTGEVEVLAVQRKQSCVLKPVLSRDRAEIVKAKRDTGRRELRDGMNDWMDNEG